MKKNFLVILISFICFVSSQIGFCQSEYHLHRPLETYQQGALYQYGKIAVVNLHGSYREMGQEYGYLLHDPLHQFYAAIIDLLVKQQKVPYSKLVQMGKILYDTYPQRFKELLNGMSETSGLTLNQHRVINAFEHYIFNSDLMHPAQQGCSALVVWGAYTKTKELIFGRNYDFGVDISPFKKFLVIAVFHPVGSGNSTAIITFLGTLNATTEMNDQGLFLELNNGGVSDGGLSYANRISTPIELLAIMIDTSNLMQLDQELHTINSNTAFIINVADDKNAYSYEWPPFGIRKRSGDKKGLLAVTNHFVLPWGMPKSTDRFYLTVTRRKNLLKLGEKYKGRFDVLFMEKILKVPIKRGGATSYHLEKNAPLTGFQVIAIPKKMNIYLREPGYQPWTMINLKFLFDH